MNKLEILKLKSNIMGQEKIIYPVLIRDEKSNILVDTGFFGQLEEFKRAFNEIDFDINDLDMIIVTHQDIDHVGNIKTILNEVGNKKIKVVSSKEEAPFINGEKTPHKLAYMEKIADHLPKEQLGFYEMLKRGFENTKANIDDYLNDKEILPHLGGIEVISTPGHTIGHICLYIKESKTLIAGDLLFLEDNKLRKADSNINYDNEKYEESIQKILNYDIENVVCYHGGLYKGKIEL